MIVAVIIGMNITHFVNLSSLFLCLMTEQLVQTFSARLIEASQRQKRQVFEKTCLENSNM